MPQTTGIDAASHAYQLCRLANGKAKQTAELGLKEASFSKQRVFTFHYSSRHNKKEANTPDCLATMPRGPGTIPLSRARFPAPLSPTTASVSAATIHRGPPASQPCIQRYIITHGRPEASSLHSSLAIRCSNHRWGKPSSRHQTKHNILATAL